MIAHYHEEIDGWCNFEDLYRQAVKRVPPGGLMVEVGVWKGKSLSYLAVQAMNTDKGLLVCGVDHFQGSVDHDGTREECGKKDVFLEAYANLRRSGNDRAFLLRLPSVDAARVIGAADFVFIDASHDYESVCSDIRAWMPVVKPGGILAGHDYHHKPVRKAVADLVPDAIKVSWSSWWWEKPCA